MIVNKCCVVCCRLAGQENSPGVSAALTAAAVDADAGAAQREQQQQREERIRLLREKQTEERQRKLDELKQQVCCQDNKFFLV